MATESRSRFNKTIVPGLFALAREEYKRLPETWKEAVTVRSSGKAYEEAGYITGYGYLQEKPEGTPVGYDARIQGPTKKWVPKTYALACRISEEAIEDDLYGVMKQGIKDLAVSAKATAHLLAMRMFMTGTATTYHTAGDALALFSTAHVRLGGGTWSNLAAAAATPTEASLTTAIQNFEAITDHRGKKYDQMAQAVLCGPSLEFAFAKLLESAQEPDTANNAVNAVKSIRNLKLIVDKEITDDRWLVGGMKDPDVGFIWIWRKKPMTSRDDRDFDTGDSKFSVSMRCSNEANDPRQWYMVPAS